MHDYRAGTLAIVIVAALMLFAASAQSAPLGKATSQTSAEIEDHGMTPVKVKCSDAGRNGKSRLSCRWTATKADGSLCDGKALVVEKKSKLSKVRCSLKAANRDARAAVRAAIAGRGQEPGSIECSTARPRWVCAWEAFETIAGWRYSCLGRAHATTAAGPYSLEPCQLHAPELAPLTATPGPHPPFGFNDNWSTLLDAVPAAKSIGVDTVRYGLGWSVVERTPGGANWARYDLAYTTMVAAGIRPVFVIIAAPCWAAETCDNPELAVPSVEHDADWANFAANVAKRYPRARAIEVWNEPNYGPYFEGAPDPERYAELLSLAHAAIKAVDPSMPVLSAGLAPFTRDDRAGEMSPETFLRRAYAAGGITNSSDGLAYHAYPGVGPSDDYLGGIRRLIANVREVMVTYGDAAKPIWITETGVSTQQGFSVQQQATASAAIYEQYRQIPGIAAVIFHRWMDDPRDPWEAGVGAVTTSGAPKPLFCALASVRGRPC